MVKKLEVEFDWEKIDLTLFDRKYTLTHCDLTGQRYLYVGSRFAIERCSPLRDEILGKWVRVGSETELHLECTLYTKESSLSLDQRYEKFKQHFPRALKAIIGGDQEYIEKNNLSNKNVCAYFLSPLKSNKKYYGKVKEYFMEAHA